jgi:hypothetical protein
MPEDPSTESVRELRGIRYLLGLLTVVLALMFVSHSIDMWGRSLAPPNMSSSELQGIQGELRAIRSELSSQRNPGLPRLPPLVVPAIKPQADASKTKQMLLGKWKHEKDNAVISLEFTADRLSYRNSRPNAGPPGETPYKVLDDKTLEMPRLGVAPLTEKITIDSLSADRLVLSGGESWKFDKTEFAKQK